MADPCPVIPLTPTVARLLSGDRTPTVRASAVVGGAICLQATTSDGVEEFYLDLEQAGQLALELADALDLARGFVREADR
jgi:hypothetical protein